LPLYSVVIDPNTTPYSIIVAGDGGVFQSGDQGKTWQKLGLDLPNAQMVMLAVDSNATPELLRVASWGRGAFQLVDCHKDCDAINAVCQDNCAADFESCGFETHEPHRACVKAFRACRKSCNDENAQCLASCK
jgi:hypothetical protein